MRGARGRIRGKTTGQGAYEASVNLLEAGVAQLEQALAEIDAGNISLVEFMISGIWTPPRARRNRKVEILNCALIEDGFSNALGPDETASEIKLLTDDIIHYPDAKGPGNRLIT